MDTSTRCVLGTLKIHDALSHVNTSTITDQYGHHLEFPRTPHPMVLPRHMLACSPSNLPTYRNSIRGKSKEEVTWLVTSYNPGGRGNEKAPNFKTADRVLVAQLFETQKLALG